MKQEHYNLDYYATLAKKKNYRSRASFKLLEMDKMLKLFKKDMTILDLGAAPGSWSQVAHEICGPNSIIFGIDILPIQPYKNIIFLQKDINHLKYDELLAIAQNHQIKNQHIATTQHLNQHTQVMREKSHDNTLTTHNRLYFDLVLCDICPNKSGNAFVDSSNMNIVNINTINIAKQALSKTGVLIMKFFQDEYTVELKRMLESIFQIVKSVKPTASRSISSEMYYYAKNLK